MDRGKEFRVLQIRNVDNVTLEKILTIKTLALAGGFHPLSGVEPTNNGVNNATYLFANLYQVARFGRELSLRLINYANYPATQYQSLATEEMGRLSAALFMSLAPGPEDYH